MNTNNDEKNRKYQHPLIDGDDDQGDSETTGTRGGASGEIQFRYEDMLGGPLREDLMSPTELKRILATHLDVHKSRVDNQKLTRKERKILKEGRSSLVSREETSIENRARSGNGGGGSSPYKKHPISNKAQFSGTDRQLSTLPSENNAKTNEQEKEKLENRNELRLQNTNTPKFNPKPRPY